MNLLAPWSSRAYPPPANGGIAGHRPGATVVDVAKLAWLLAAAVAVVGIVVAPRAVGHGAARNTESVALLARSLGGVAGSDAAAQDAATAAAGADAYGLDHGIYAGLTLDVLRRLEPGVAAAARVAWARDDAVCLESSARGRTASVTRPSGTVVAGACPAAAP